MEIKKDTESQVPPRIFDWFLNRGISEQVLREAEIKWTGNEIAIPVFDSTHSHILFYKYRRDPESDNGPKYRYEKGATCHLYNSHLLESSDEVIICEGEFDSLCLLSHGFVALSSTGGAGSFDESWISMFLNKKVYVVYDNDEAGIKGALNIQMLIPWAKLIWLPPKVGEHGDVTDYFVKLGKTAKDFRAMMNEAKSYFIPPPLKEIPKTKKQMQVIIKAEADYADSLLKDERDLMNRRLSYRHIGIIIQYLLNRIAQHRRTIRYMGKVRNDYQSSRDIKAAKMVPIDRFMRFDRAGNTICLWHEEKTPSLHYYPKQNRVKCFGGCGKMGDVLDIIMELKKVALPEAIDIALGNKKNE